MTNIASFEKLQITLDDLKFKVKIIEDRSLKAIVSIDFNDFIVKGFRISHSDFESERGDNYWITPPSYKDSGGRYHPIFFTTNKPLWKEIEARIVDEYKLTLDEHYKKRFKLDDTEIPTK